MFIDRLKAYASFDVSTRRPIYSKLLRIDKSEEAMIKKVDEIYSTEYQTAYDFLKMLNLSLNELDKSKDPLILFAKGVFKESLEYEKESEEISAKRKLLK